MLGTLLPGRGVRYCRHDLVALVLGLESVEVATGLSIGSELVVGLERLVFLDYCSHLEDFLSLSLL